MGSVAKAKIVSSSRWSVLSELVEIVFSPADHPVVVHRNPKKMIDAAQLITKNGSKEGIVGKDSEAIGEKKMGKNPSHDSTKIAETTLFHWEEKWWIHMLIITCLVGLLIAGTQSFFVDIHRLHFGSS